MTLASQASIAIPFFHSGTASGGVTQPMVGSSEHTPSSTLILGIDLVDDGLFENDHILIQTAGSAGNVHDLFQAFVYATSQGYFAWRGELALPTGFALQAVPIVGSWDFHVWGAVIPTLSLTP